MGRKGELAGVGAANLAFDGERGAKPDPVRYDPVARFLHWAIALAFLLLFVTGFVADALPRGAGRALLYDAHRSLGCLALSIALFRIGWRGGHPAPALPDRIPRLQRRAAAATHLLLYAAMVAQPVTGILMYWLDGEAVGLFGLQLPPLVATDPPLAAALRRAHEALPYAIALLLVMHVGAALKHHFVDRDDVLRRMAG